MMSDQWQDHKPNCYIEFRVNDQERFAVLVHFFKSLRQWTQGLDSGYGDADSTLASRQPTRPSDETQEITLTRQEQTISRREFGRPAEWMLAFRPKDLQFMRMPDHAEAVKTLDQWQGMSRRERRRYIKAQDNKQELQILADFVDMIRYWQDVEFTLISCEKDLDLGRVEYSTFDFPFKGKVALEELLLFFGFFSIIHNSC